MATPTCPECGCEMCPEQVDVVAGTATCTPCDRAWSLAVLAGVETEASDEVPPGCQVIDEVDARVIECRVHGKAPAVIAGVFSCVWNGMVWGLFMPSVISGLVRSGGGTNMLLGLVFLLFLLPFVAIGIVIAGFAVLLRWGKTAISIGPSAGEVFIGVGRIGWRRRFEPSLVTDVRESVKMYEDDGKTVTKRSIEIVGPGKPLKVSAPQENMHAWLLRTLRAELLGR